MRWSGILSVAAAMLVGGCSEVYWTSNVRETMSLGPSGAIATNADVRLVHRFRGREMVPVPGPTGEMNRFAQQDREYLCAEPSPDVARVVQAALSNSISASGTGTPATGGVAIEAQLASQLNASRSEGIAQLTKRIATIQLLRDGLYRACEAYANGAIGREIYTAIISRYDRMMITMLLGEMAAGNLGSAAILTGNAAAAASGEASAGPGGRAAVAESQYQRAKDENETQIRKVAALKTERAQAETRRANKEKAGQDFSAEQQEVQALDAKIEAETKIQEITQADMTAADAARKAAADAAKGAAAIAATRGNSSASSSGFFDSPAKAAVDAARATGDVLARMQRTYMNEPHGQSLIMMCFSELAGLAPMRQYMKKFCDDLTAHVADENGRRLIYDTTAAPQLTELGTDRVDAIAKALQAMAATGKASPEAVRALLATATPSVPAAPAKPAAQAKPTAPKKPPAPSDIE